MRRERLLPYVFVTPALAFITLFALYPIIDSFWLSLHRIILSLPFLGEPYVGLENYRGFINDPVAWRSFGITFAFVSVSTVLEIFFGLLIALIIHKSFSGFDYPPCYFNPAPYNLDTCKLL